MAWLTSVSATLGLPFRLMSRRPPQRAAADPAAAARAHRRPADVARRDRRGAASAPRRRDRSRRRQLERGARAACCPVNQVEVLDAPWLARGEPRRSTDPAASRRTAGAAGTTTSRSTSRATSARTVMAWSRARAPRRLRDGRRRSAADRRGARTTRASRRGQRLALVERAFDLHAGLAAGAAGARSARRRVAARCPSAHGRRRERRSRNWPARRLPARLIAAHMPRAAARSSSGPSNALPRRPAGSRARSDAAVVLTGGA